MRNADPTKKAGLNQCTRLVTHIGKYGKNLVGDIATQYMIN